MRPTAWAVAAFLVSAHMPTGVPAHHAFSAEFSRDLPLEITGTVTRVEWMNPHARFYVDAAGENGETVEWNFELASPNSLMRQGWRHDSLKAGDKVTVAGVRARNSPYIGNAGSVTLADGTRVFSNRPED